MNKDILIKLLTGVVSKWLRRGLYTAAGALGAKAAGDDGGLASEQLALALVTFFVTVGWSIIEQRQKAKPADEPEQSKIP